jgi:hypothetical protein
MPPLCFRIAVFAQPGSDAPMWEQSPKPVTGEHDLAASRSYNRFTVL